MLYFICVLVHRYHGKPDRAEVLRAAITSVCYSCRVRVLVPSPLANLCVSTFCPPNFPVIFYLNEAKDCIILTCGLLHPLQFPICGEL